MPLSSGTYNFQSITVELLIREAFERIGILGELVESQKMDSARRSINLLLLEWMSKSVNLWTLQTAYLSLVTGQAQYVLPITVSDVIQVNNRISSRQLNGVAASSAGGNADYAFDNNPNTACTQTAPNGNISYDYGTLQTITFLGICSNTNNQYSITVEYSLDNISWFSLIVIEPQVYNLGTTAWFDVITPVAARAYRIRETAGATLDIQEIYFNNSVLDYNIANVSRYNYNTFSNKTLVSRPSCYYLDRQATNPTLYIYPAPTSYYNCIFYSYKKYIQDVGLYTNSLQIPSRFYPALIWGLCWQLALKFNPAIAESMKSEYLQAFDTATIEDSEKISLRIEANYSECNYA